MPSVTIHTYIAILLSLDPLALPVTVKGALGLAPAFVPLPATDTSLTFEIVAGVGVLFIEVDEGLAVFLPPTDGAVIVAWKVFEASEEVAFQLG